MYIISAHLTALQSSILQSRKLRPRDVNELTYTRSHSLVSWDLNPVHRNLKSCSFFYGDLISKKTRRKRLMAFFLLFGVKKRKDFAFRIGLRQKKVTHSCARS